MEVSEQFAEKAPSFHRVGARDQTQGLSRLITMLFHGKLSYWPYSVDESMTWKLRFWASLFGKLCLVYLNGLSLPPGNVRNVLL